jgi:hypothetical protein
VTRRAEEGRAEIFTTEYTEVTEAEGRSVNHGGHGEVFAPRSAGERGDFCG